jgi:long-chain acyl-CoA synthetase
MTSPLADRAPSFARLFLDRVEADPDRTAFLAPLPTGGWRELTWRQTKNRVVDLAAGLLSLGIGIEDRVAIASSTRLDWVLADLAIMCAGAATTTVYPSTTTGDVGYILSDSGSRVVFAEDDAQIEKVRAANLGGLLAVVTFDGAADGETVLSLDQLADRGKALLAENSDAVTDVVSQLRPDHLATLIYTSGTTGRPKGVRLVNDNWTFEGASVDSVKILSPDDVQYLWLPLSHVFGKVLIGIQLTIGFATAVDGNLDKIVENLGQIKPTFMAGAPRIFEKVRSRVMLTATSGGGIKAKIFDWGFRVGLRVSRLRQANSKVPMHVGAQYKIADKLVFGKIRSVVGGRIRFFVSGSAPLSREVAEWFDAAGMQILEGYGLTESSAASCVNMPFDYRIGTVGPPLPGMETIIAADGEILLRGPGIMRGYHNMTTETEEVLTADGWLHTGDIGELVDGYLRVTDRKKDLIKTSGGKYVAPQKIETVFKAVCPYASQILVHGEGRKFVSALITLDEDTIGDWAAANGLAGKSVEELSREPAVRTMMSGYVDELNSKLERWETIKKFVILPRDLSVDDGELTPSMKVRRRAVEKMYKTELDALYTD